MSEKKWIGAKAWREKANAIAPAIVGGSKKHGGPDLGPTRAKEAWASLAVMIENVKGILGAVFENYRRYIAAQFTKLGYESAWRLVCASEFGVSQVRPRAVLTSQREHGAHSQ